MEADGSSQPSRAPIQTMSIGHTAAKGNNSSSFRDSQHSSAPKRRPKLPKRKQGKTHGGTSQQLLSSDGVHQQPSRDLVATRASGDARKERRARKDAFKELQRDKESKNLESPKAPNPGSDQVFLSLDQVMNLGLRTSVAPPQQILHWCALTPVPLQAEEDAVKILIHWGKSERGMMKDQPSFRLQQVTRMCRRNGMQLSQALSLRRQHMQKMHYLNIEKLGLGTENDVKAAADCFEEAVESTLRKLNIPIWTEKEQRLHFKNLNIRGPSPPTPDFIFRNKVILRKSSGSGANRHIVDELVIHWIEVKMFYGASTIPNDNRSAVGKLLKTAKKYNTAYGPGALLFMYGCGDRLAADLAKEGVIVLDCSGGMVDLELVYAQLRTWCANKNGDILP
jgi:hypothetical protein